MAVIVWREFQGAPHTGINSDTSGVPALDQGGIPAVVDEVFLPAAGMPWGDALEDPEAVYDPSISFSQDPTVFDPTVGNAQIVGAYDGAYQTRGPVVPFGHEVSGGLHGDQALGRVMRFANNGPERHDPNGVQFPSWADELAASLYYNGQGFVSENESTTTLIQSL